MIQNNITIGGKLDFDFLENVTNYYSVNGSFGYPYSGAVTVEANSTQTLYTSASLATYTYITTENKMSNASLADCMVFGLLHISIKNNAHKLIVVTKNCGYRTEVVPGVFITATFSVRSTTSSLIDLTLTMENTDDVFYQMNLNTNESFIGICKKSSDAL